MTNEARSGADVRVDSDVLAVAIFMQERMAASRLVAVADGLAAIAPLLWGHYEAEAVQALRLAWPEKPITKPAASNVLDLPTACAGDGSAAEVFD